MIPVDITWMFGAVLAAGILIALFVVRLRRKRQPSSKVVDLAMARRRKAQAPSGKPSEKELRKPKQTVVTPTGAVVSKFISKKSGARLQPCSRCQKKSDSIGFYVDDYGNMTGLCKECRKSSKKRDLMPL